MDILSNFKYIWRGRTREQEAHFTGPTNRIFIEKNSLLIQFSGNFELISQNFPFKSFHNNTFGQFPALYKTGNLIISKDLFMFFYFLFKLFLCLFN